MYWWSHPQGHAVTLFSFKLLNQGETHSMFGFKEWEWSGEQFGGNLRCWNVCSNSRDERSGQPSWLDSDWSSTVSVVLVQHNFLSGSLFIINSLLASMVVAAFESRCQWNCDVGEKSLGTYNIETANLYLCGLLTSCVYDEAREWFVKTLLFVFK